MRGSQLQGFKVHGVGISMPATTTEDRPTKAEKGRKSRSTFKLHTGCHCCATSRKMFAGLKLTGKVVLSARRGKPVASSASWEKIGSARLQSLHVGIRAIGVMGLQPTPQDLQSLCSPTQHCSCSGRPVGTYKGHRARQTRSKSF